MLGSILLGQALISTLYRIVALYKALK